MGPDGTEPTNLAETAIDNPFRAEPHGYVLLGRKTPTRGAAEEQPYPLCAVAPYPVVDGAERQGAWTRPHSKISWRASRPLIEEKTVSASVQLPIVWLRLSQPFQMG